MGLLASTNFAGSGAVSPAIDTTGATLLVVYGVAGSAATVNDSEGNSWTAGVSYGPGFPPFHVGRFLYVVNPTTNASHTFQGFGANLGMAIAAFDGTLTTGAFDVEAAALFAGVTSAQAGGVTPTTADSLILAALGMEQAVSEAIGSGFTLGPKQSFNSGINYAATIAYKYVSSLGAEDPTWTWSGSADGGAALLVFKAPSSGGGGGPAPTPVAPQLGSGGVIYRPSRVVAF